MRKENFVGKHYEIFETLVPKSLEANGYLAQIEKQNKNLSDNQYNIQIIIPSDEYLNLDKSKFSGLEFEIFAFNSEKRFGANILTEQINKLNSILKKQFKNNYELYFKSKNEQDYINFNQKKEKYDFPKVA